MVGGNRTLDEERDSRCGGGLGCAQTIGPGVANRERR